MAFAGLKKQINKANQYMTEKIGGVEGTKLDVDFVDMERKTDVTYELVEELQLKTKEFLQPNPTARAKMAAVKGISKLSGQAKASTYPQAEGTLGDCLLLYGKKLGDDSLFGQALQEMGEALKQMADVKYALDDNTKQNFLEPLHHLQTKDLKEVMHHRKKLQGRRLDYDCKRRKQAKGSHVSDEELKQAEEKFAESLHSAQIGMFNLLDNDVEQISQLTTFAESLLEYHQQCSEILKLAFMEIQEKRDQAASRPKLEFVPKTLNDLHPVDVISDDINDEYELMEPRLAHVKGSSRASSPTHSKSDFTSGSNHHDNQHQQPHHNASPVSSPVKSVQRQIPRNSPCCTALYDFEAENPGELGFKEGETIILLNRVDENWFEGSTNGRTGYFPVTYVQVVVPLP
ncbi:endophilin-A isoform X1 [Adelges cooleyi]|uniref:endophilin-A isoform X1 n=1 Tax=Adelges cooleyi TaxID=133065 RepID=UPI00217FE43A|nr:endophilin-A isoform X1 [Adelges cooleyi]XP_050427877.1 endophilin-A isoform X1 [Adelges cooleyi]